MAGCRARSGAVNRAVKVQFNLAALGRSKWYEYAVRFAFGGAVTVLAGPVAKRYGPEIGGLFLAFPAIFPATATLLEKHEKQKEPNPWRARQVAGIDAAGASVGSIRLMVFAIVVCGRDCRAIPSSSYLPPR